MFSTGLNRILKRGFGLRWGNVPNDGRGASEVGVVYKIDSDTFFFVMRLFLVFFGLLFSLYVA